MSNANLRRVLMWFITSEYFSFFVCHEFSYSFVSFNTLRTHSSEVEVNVTLTLKQNCILFKAVCACCSNQSPLALFATAVKAAAAKQLLNKVHISTWLDEYACVFDLWCGSGRPYGQNMHFESRFMAYILWLNNKISWVLRI